MDYVEGQTINIDKSNEKCITVNQLLNILKVL